MATININDFRINLLDNINKFRSGSVPPNRVDNWLQQASIELFNEKRLAAIQNQKINDDLSPFLKSFNLPVTAPEGQNYGLIEKPTSDYTYFWSMRAFFTGTIQQPISCGCPTSDNSACDARKNLIQTPTPIELLPIVKEVRVQLVDSSVWDSILNHRTKFPSIDRPYCNQFDGGFRVAPRNLNIVTLDCYRLPRKAVFGYTVVPNNVTGVPYYQYDAATSTQPEWDEQVKDELLDRVMKLASVYLGNPILYQQADNLKQTRA